MLKHENTLLPRVLTCSFITMIAGGLLSSCHLMGSDERRISQAAEEFAECYFNYDLDKAVNCCTPESKPWIQLLASNLSPEDIQHIRESQQTEINIGDAELLTDSSAVVPCQVKGFIDITADTTMQQRTYLIPLVCRNGQWRVRMAGPLRSEKQNPSQD